MLTKAVKADRVRGGANMGGDAEHVYLGFCDTKRRLIVRVQVTMQESGRMMGGAAALIRHCWGILHQQSDVHQGPMIVGVGVVPTNAHV